LCLCRGVHTVGRRGSGMAPPKRSLQLGVLNLVYY